MSAGGGHAHSAMGLKTGSHPIQPYIFYKSHLHNNCRWSWNCKRIRKLFQERNHAKEGHARGGFAKTQLQTNSRANSSETKTRASKRRAGMENNVVVITVKSSSNSCNKPKKIAQPSHHHNRTADLSGNSNINLIITQFHQHLKKKKKTPQNRTMSK